MITNTFIPINIPLFYKYMLSKYKINIYEISTDNWYNMIDTNYCRNIEDNKFCFKKYKKNIVGTDFCSKCCERKKIKRKNVYKKKKTNKKEDIVNDSAFYSETDNNTDLENDKKYIKFGDIDFELDKKYVYLTNSLQNLKSEKYKSINNHHIDNNCIKFGELDIKINNKNINKESKTTFIKNYNILKNINEKNTNLEKLNYNIISNLEINDKNSLYQLKDNTELSTDNDSYKSDNEILLNNAYIDIRYIEKYIEFIIDEIDKLKYKNINKYSWAENIFNSLEYFCFIPREYKIYKNINGDIHLEIDDLGNSIEYLNPFIC